MSRKGTLDFLAQHGLLDPDKQYVSEEEEANIIEPVEEEEMVVEVPIVETEPSHEEEIIEDNISTSDVIGDESFADAFDFMREEIEEIENNQEENIMSNKTLSKMILESNAFRKYETLLEGEEVKGKLTNRLIYPVKSIKMPRQAFYEKFLSANTEITNQEKEEMVKEYYPSAFNGSSVEFIMFIDVPKDAIETVVNTGNHQHVSPLFWTSSVGDVKKFTDKYPEIFGSRVLIPTLNVVDREGRSYYRIFISTLHAILFVEGLSIKDLRDRMTLVAISTALSARNDLNLAVKDPIQYGLNQGSIEISNDYIIQYIKR